MQITAQSLGGKALVDQIQRIESIFHCQGTIKQWSHTQTYMRAELQTLTYTHKLEAAVEPDSLHF